MHYEKVKNTLIEVLESSRTNPQLSDLIEKFRKKKVVIYGAGYCGRFILRILSNYNIIPVYFLDINTNICDSIDGIPVYTPTPNNFEIGDKDNAVVILCVISNNKEQSKIIENILAIGYNNVLLCEDIYFSFSRILDTNILTLDYNYYKENESKILECVDLFSDDLSLETYKNNMVAHILRKFNCAQPALDELQYFPSDIHLAKGYSRFVDCGAYNGDTINDLIKLKGIPEAIFAFEPDMDNFSKLSQYVSLNELNNTVLYPCGLSKKTELLHFNMKSSTDSSISKNGDTVIQCTALDEVLKNVSPTFIKMDIEGSEYDALIGAKSIISKYKPDLAICVYHYVNHYFEIPLLINSWDLGYKFYLRAYGDCGNETVMYATSER